MTSVIGFFLWGGKQRAISLCGRLVGQRGIFHLCLSNRLFKRILSSFQILTVAVSALRALYLSGYPHVDKRTAFCTKAKVVHETLLIVAYELYQRCEDFDL